MSLSSAPDGAVGPFWQAGRLGADSHSVAAVVASMRVAAQACRLMLDAPSPDPLAVLVQWHAEAVTLGVREPDAMTLATATADGCPSARVVLFKGIVAGAIQFVTHHASRKGHEMQANPQVALVFFWAELARQVRIEGRAERAPDAVSDAYFGQRPRESQLGAWASHQSQRIASRAELEGRLDEVTQRFLGRPVERPSGWGMHWVRPQRVELWIAGSHRLHDRFAYTWESGHWQVARLAP